MTERLYYSETYLREFEATVTSVIRDGSDSLITLDRSAFYPTSGGQPHDTGTLNGFSVTDVTVAADGEVIHHVSGAASLECGTAVKGVIDWPRRLDHMQQHGGEHMLAGAIYEMLGGGTVGLHLGQTESTIDVSFADGRTHVTAEEIRMLEDLVNQRIRADVPVICWFPSPEELASLPLRKAPTVKEHIRIVAFGDFEMVACGGTHPSTSGQIGLLHILSVTPARGKARFAFVCGGRALAHYRALSEQTDKTVRLLSCPVERMAEAVAELQQRNADLTHELYLLRRDELFRKMTDAMTPNGLACVALEEADADAAQAAVQEFIQSPGRVILLGFGSRLIFARSGDRKEDMAALIRQVGRGGGRPDFASGTGTDVSLSEAGKLLENDT